VQFDFSEVLTRAWQITWKNKRLWIFGFVLILLSFLFLPLMLAPMLADIFTNYQMDEAILLAMMLSGFLLFMLIIYPVSALLNVALTLGVLRAEHGDEKISFMELIRESYPFFWRYLGTMTLFVGGMLFVILFFSIVIMAISVVTFGLGMFCMIPFSFLQYPLMLIWYVCMEQSLTAVVADNLKVIDSVKHSWQLLKKNIWVYVLVGLVFYFGVSMISSAVMMPFIFPLFFLPFALESAEFGRIVLVITGLCMVLFMPIFSFFQGGVMTLMKSGWVLTYLRLTRGSAAQPVLLEAASS
jgi:hypothetical protein